MIPDAGPRTRPTPRGRDAGSFSQFPRGRAAGARDPRAALEVLVAVAPASGVAAGTDRHFWAVVLTAAAGLVLAVALRRGRTVLRLPAISIVLVACSILTAGVAGGRGAAVTLLLSAVAIGAGRGPARADAAVDPSDRGGSEFVPVAGIALLAGVVGWRTGWSAVVVVVQAASILVAWATARHPGRVGAVVDAVERTVRWFFGALGAVLISVIGVLFVLLPWAVSRVVAWDPTWSRRPEGSRFVPLRRSALRPDRQWRGRVELLPPGPGRRIHALALAIPLGVVAAVVLLVSVPGLRDGDDEGQDSAAMADSPWWPSARPAQLATFDEAALSAFLGPVLRDVSTEWTNVVDGRRTTWEPDSPEYTIWLFGGSSAFGLGQRDEHTIASELAKAAAEAGVPVEVVNMGVHGDVLWMERNRMLAALAAGMEAPDLMIFYDGFNDLATVNHLNGGDGVPDVPYVGSLDSAPLSRRGTLAGFGSWLGGLFDDTGLEPPPQERHLDDSEVVDRAAVQYGSALDWIESDLDRSDLSALFVYQPSRVTRDVDVPGEADDGEQFEQMEREFRRRLPASVLDLSAAMDGTDAPIYWDSVHTNELGARIVAEALLPEVLSTLGAAPGGGD